MRVGIRSLCPPTQTLITIKILSFIQLLIIKKHSQMESKVATKNSQQKHRGKRKKQFDSKNLKNCFGSVCEQKNISI